MNVLAELGMGHYIVTTLFVITCLLLILIVLLQKGRGGGLASAFGGGGGSSAFGAKTGDVFTWVTVVLAGVFLLLAIIANFIFRPEVIAVIPPPSISPAQPIDSPVSIPPTSVILTPNTPPADESETDPIPAAPTPPADDPPASSESNQETPANP